MKLTKREKDFLIFAIEEARSAWEYDLYNAVTAAEMDKGEIEWIKYKIEQEMKLVRKVREENDD